MHFSGSGLHILCAYACRHGACSVTPQQENALRSIARQANSEIKKVRQQFPDKNVNDICRSVETVTLKGFTPTHLSLAIGMLNGVFKER
ncbi:TPA: cell division protein ZapA [Escherichia coli]|nr:cell division protein ZapA [Escherichia coli]